MAYKNNIENKDFGFNEKITTVSLAKYFAYSQNNKFVFQSNTMYYFKGMYWKRESNKTCFATFNIFSANELYN